MPPPLGFNRGPMLSFETELRRVADLAREQGATVETRTVLVREIRSVGGKDVAVLVAVRREASLRMPGSDRVTPVLTFEAHIDPGTRATTVVPNPRSR